MTVRHAHLSELAPDGGEGFDPGPVFAAPESGTSSGEPAPSRAALRMERRQERRQRRLWALLGLMVLAAAFGVAVGVLDVIR